MMSPSFPGSPSTWTLCWLFWGPTIQGYTHYNPSIICWASYSEGIIFQQQLLFFQFHSRENWGWWRDAKELSLNPQPEDLEPGSGSGWEATVPTERVPGWETTRDWGLSHQLTLLPRFYPLPTHTHPSHCFPYLQLEQGIWDVWPSRERYLEE